MSGGEPLIWQCRVSSADTASVGLRLPAMVMSAGSTCPYTIVTAKRQGGSICSLWASDSCAGQLLPAMAVSCHHTERLRMSNANNPDVAQRHSRRRRRVPLAFFFDRQGTIPHLTRKKFPPSNAAACLVARWRPTLPAPLQSTAARLHPILPPAGDSAQPGPPAAAPARAQRLCTCPLAGGPLQCRGRPHPAAPAHNQAGIIPKFQCRKQCRSAAPA